MIKLYRTNREVQLQWMRENPGKTIGINVLIGAAFLGYYMYQDHKDRREAAEEIIQLAD